MWEKLTCTKNVTKVDYDARVLCGREKDLKRIEKQIGPDRRNHAIRKVKKEANQLGLLNR